MISSSSRDCGYVGSLLLGLSTYPQSFRSRSSYDWIADYGDIFI